jgi:hypothetical protein
LENFKASDGWLQLFKRRHSIVFKSVQGEAADVDIEGLKAWQQDVLQKEISKFKEDDVYNADESGLFWHLLPNRTLAFKGTVQILVWKKKMKEFPGEPCTSGKKSKERITMLVCANSSGTEKKPIFIVCKAANPRCFKNKVVPLKYEANTKAWMTGKIFEMWLNEWDKKLQSDKRKILLCLDNFSGHPNLPLNNIKMIFFPPNSTSKSQVYPN